MSQLPNHPQSSYPYQHPSTLNPVHGRPRAYEQPPQTAGYHNASGSQSHASHYPAQNMSAPMQPYAQGPSTSRSAMHSHPTSPSPSLPRPAGAAAGAGGGNDGLYSPPTYPLSNAKSPVYHANPQQTPYYPPQQNPTNPGYFQSNFPSQNMSQYDQGMGFKPNVPIGPGSSAGMGGGWHSGPASTATQGSQNASSFSLPLGSASMTTQALTAIVGSQVLKQEEMSRLVSWPVMKLRPYFQVTNSYVSKKLAILLFPFGHKSWQRVQASSGSQMAMPGSVPVYSASGPGSGESNTCTSVPVLYALPKEDNNAPDLYIPTMAFVTYVVLVGMISGVDGKFQPDVLGVTASSAFVMSLVELLIIKLGCYLLSFGNEVALLDVLAYVGYKYVGLDLTLLAGLVYPGPGAICVWLYTGLTFALFLLRSLRHAILPDSTSGFYHEQRRKRIHFLLIIAALQLVFSYFLIVEPTATPSLIKPPPLAEETTPLASQSSRSPSSSYGERGSSSGGAKRKGGKVKIRKPSPIVPDEKEGPMSEEDDAQMKSKVDRR